MPKPTPEIQAYGDKHFVAHMLAAGKTSDEIKLALNEVVNRKLQDARIAYQRQEEDIHKWLADQRFALDKYTPPAT